MKKVFLGQYYPLGRKYPLFLIEFLGCRNGIPAVIMMLARSWKGVGEILVRKSRVNGRSLAGSFTAIFCQCSRYGEKEGALSRVELKMQRITYLEDRELTLFTTEGSMRVSVPLISSASPEGFCGLSQGSPRLGIGCHPRWPGRSGCALLPPRLGGDEVLSPAGP